MLTRPLRLDVQHRDRPRPGALARPGTSRRIAERAALRQVRQATRPAKRLAVLWLRSIPEFLGPVSPANSRRSWWMRDGGSRRWRITQGWPTFGRHWATALQTRAAATTSGRQQASMPAITAGLPVARPRTRPTSGSPWSSGLDLRTRIETIDSLLAESRASGLLLSRAWLLAMLDRGTEAWQDAREADARLHEQSGHRWSEWWLAELSSLDCDHEGAPAPTRRLRRLDETEQLPFLQLTSLRLRRSLCRSAASTKRRGRRASSIARRGARPSGAGLWRVRCSPASTRIAANYRGRTAGTRGRGHSRANRRAQRTVLGSVGPRGGAHDRGPHRRGSVSARAGTRTMPEEKELRIGSPDPSPTRATP